MINKNITNNIDIVLKIKKLEKGVKLPQKQSKDAAAFDLYSLEDKTLLPFVITPVHKIGRASCRERV